MLTMMKKHVWRKLIRSRINWVENGERNNKFFLSLEKQRQTKKTITKLKQQNGKIANDKIEILKEIEQFYSSLYTTNNPKKDEIVQYINECKTNNRLSDTERDKCEGKLTVAECTSAIKKFKPNKSPGSDGLSAEFYKTFWHKIDNIVVDSLNYAYKNGELSDSQKIGVVSLIYKKNDALDLKNWRPITLLNIDYKIAAHALAERLKTVISKIIDTDQNGYLKNRFIGYKIRQIQDIIDYSEKFNIDACVIFLDFSKAFDTIEWEFMYESLKKFGFGSSFIHWTKTLYSNIKGCVKNNNWLTSCYKISRGIRQGCPLSCLIFVIAAEILACKIRSNNEIYGVKIKNKNIKISQLADDTTLFSKYVDVKKLLKLVENFGDISGLKLNKEKTEGIYLGQNKKKKTKRMPV